MPALRRALLLSALALAAAPAGCSSSEPKPTASEPAVDLSPIPAPAGLVAEAFLPTPDTTWAKARIAVGGPALFLPVNAGTLIANLLGLPPTVAAEIDGNVPMLGAVVDPENGAVPALRKGKDDAPERTPPRAALGVHVKSGSRFVDQLTRGEGARFDAKVDTASSITLLTPKSAAPAGSSAAEPAPRMAGGRVVLGVLGNYLLLGAGADDLRAVGPYVVRTLSKAAPPKEDVAIEIPRAAIDGPIHKAARGLWDQIRPLTEAGGAEASTLAPTIESWLAILGDLERARLTLVLNEAAHLRFEATPRTGGPAERAAADAAVGDVKPLLELPADALAGLLVRESSAGRKDGIARQVQAVLRLLGREVPEKEQEQIGAVLGAVSEARGDWFTAALRWEGVGPTVMARAAVADEKKLADAVGELVGLTKVPSIKAFLKDEELRVSSGKHVVERLEGDARRVRFERAEEKAKAGDKKSDKGKGDEPAEARDPSLPKAVNLVYLFKDGSLFAAAGYEPDEGMRRIVGAAAGGERLGGVPAFQGVLGGLGADTSFALVLDPLRILATRAGKPAPAEVLPVVVATGAVPPASGGAAALWGRLDVPTAVLKELVRRRGSL